MVDVYNTHLHASYVDSVKYKGMEVVDEYLSTRVSQAFELAQFVRSTAHNHLAILAGDLNSTPDSTCIKCVKTGMLLLLFAIIIYFLIIDEKFLFIE